MNRKLLVAISLGALALALTGAVTACGGGDDSNGVASLSGTGTNEDGGSSGGNGSSKPSKADVQQAALDFAKCMREHGIDMPDPGPDGGITLTIRPNENRAKVAAAQRACEPIMQRAQPQLSDEQENAMQEALLDFARCMREHGVDMPDPTFGSGGKMMMRANRKGSNFDPNDPTFKKAQQACQHIINDAARENGLPQGTPGTSRSREGS